MHIAIVGFDTDGKATYEYYVNHHPNYKLTICDQKTNIAIPAGVESSLGDDYLDDLDRFDLIYRSSGIQPQKLLTANPGIADKITTQVNEFCKLSPTSNIIGVTGTKGKGTTSTLITKMLEATGKTVRLGGNIGVPPLSFIDDLDAQAWVVLELSSFQLSDFRQAPHIGVCLMVVPEHLDWHADFDDYITAKEQLFTRQGTADVAVYYHGNETSKRIASAGQAHKVPYYHSPGAEVVDGAIVIDGTEICRTDELRLLGSFNWQNVCAAVTAVWYAALEICGPAEKPDVDAIRQVLTSFSGLPSRLEFVRELQGIKYYNDTFGTTPETASVAVEAFTQPKVLILGGSIKGTSYDDLAQTIAKANVRQCIIIGNTSNQAYPPAAPLIERSLQKAGVTRYELMVQPGGPSMADVVAAARAAAKPGDIVLLSTGSASYDMFMNYKDRGAQFTAAVTALQ